MNTKKARTILFLLIAISIGHCLHADENPLIGNLGQEQVDFQSTENNVEALGEEEQAGDSLNAQNAFLLQWIERLQDAFVIISDPSDKAFLHSIIKDPTILYTDMKVVARVQDIFERVEYIKIFTQIANRPSTREEDKKVISAVLANQALFNDEKIREQLQAIIDVELERITSERIQKNTQKNVAQRKKKNIRNAMVLTFSIYRKMALIRALNNGYGVSFLQRFANWAFAGFYGGWLICDGIAPFMPMIKTAMANDSENDIQPSASPLDFDMGAMNEAQNNIFEALISVMKICSDDYPRAYSKLKSDAASKFAMEPLAFNSLLRQHDLELLAPRDILKFARGCACEDMPRIIKETGCRGLELDFYDAFDAHLDMVLEKSVNRLLKKIEIPQAIRTVFLQNGGIRFFRRMLMFKFLPVYLYTVSVNKLYGEGSVSKIPLKEAMKSTTKAAREALVLGFLHYLNGKPDPESGKGRLDSAKDYSLGLVGPNLITKLGDLVMPQLTMLAFGQIPESWRNGLNMELRDFEAYNEGDGQFRQNFVHEMSVYGVKSVITYLLIKFLGKFRPPAMKWCSAKLKLQMQSLIAEKRLNASTYEGLAEFVSFLQSDQLKSLGYMAYVELLTRSETRVISSFDINEAVVESYRKKDFGILFDYFFANLVGKMIGEWTYNRWIAPRNLAY